MANFTIQPIGNKVSGSGRGAKKKEREAIATELTKKPLTFLSRYGVVNANALIGGQKLTIPNVEGELTLVSSACDICGLTHGAPRGDRTEYDAELLALTGVFKTADNKLVVLSDSCVSGHDEKVDKVWIHHDGYIERRFRVNPAIITNAGEFAKEYGLALPKSGK